MANFNDCLQFIQINALDGYDIRKGSSDTDMVFKFDRDESPEQNQNRLKSIMSITDGSYFHLKGWKGANSARGTFTFDFENHPQQQSQQQQVAGIGAVTYDESYIQSQIDAAVARVEYKFKQDDLERREKELAEEKRQFNSERDSMLGVIVEKCAPLLAGVLSRNGAAAPAAAVGTASDGLHVADIQQTTEPVGTEPEGEPLPDEVYDLLSRWSEVDSDWLSLLGKIVALAESGDQKYTIAKSMI